MLLLLPSSSSLWPFFISMAVLVRVAVLEAEETRTVNESTAYGDDKKIRAQLPKRKKHEETFIMLSFCFNQTTRLVSQSSPTTRQDQPKCFLQRGNDIVQFRVNGNRKRRCTIILLRGFTTVISQPIIHVIYFPFCIFC